MKDAVRRRVLERFKKKIEDPFDDYRRSAVSLEELREHMGKRNFELKAELAVKGWRLEGIDWVPYGSSHCACGHPISWRYHGRLADGTSVTLGSECIEDVLVMEGIPHEHVKVFLDDVQRMIVEEVEREVVKERLEEARKLLSEVDDKVLKKTWFVYSGFLENVRRIVSENERITKKQLDMLTKAVELCRVADKVHSYITSLVSDGVVRTSNISPDKVLSKPYYFKGNDLAIIWKVFQNDKPSFIVESLLTGHLIMFSRWEDAKKLVMELVELSRGDGGGQGAEREV